jgi:uncharacterized protein with von Willebrand factor type A (vWA) domain
MTAQGLLGRQLAFVAALRAAGLPVSLAESLDAAAVAAAVDWRDRESLRAGFAAALVKRPAHRRAFDVLFDLYFPAATGVAGPGDDADVDPERWRQRLADLLLHGDDADLRRFAREAVAAFGRADVQPGRQSWFGYRALRALSADTLLAGLLAALLRPEERGGLAEQVARHRLTARIGRFEELVDAETRRLRAEESGPERLARTVTPPLLDEVEFLRASRDQLAELRREVQPLARRLAHRLAARRRMGRQGRLDFRRTMRSSLSTGGVPVLTRHRPRRRHRPDLVLLCDVSGSVAAFAQFTLMLAYALREQFTRVRAFAFVDTADEVTPFFAPGTDLATATTRMAARARLVWFDGHSDYGHAFEVFEERWPDALGPGSSLLVLGDARNNYRSLGLPTLGRLVARARHAYWLNPEPRRYWDSGDSAATAYGNLLPMVECRTPTQLAAFVRTLLPR